MKFINKLSAGFLTFWVLWICKKTLIKWINLKRHHEKVCECLSNFTLSIQISSVSWCWLQKQTGPSLTWPVLLVNPTLKIFYINGMAEECSLRCFHPPSLCWSDGHPAFSRASHLVDPHHPPPKPALKCHHMCTACLSISQKLRSHGWALQPVTRLQCDRLSWMEAHIKPSQQGPLKSASIYISEPANSYTTSRTKDAGFKISNTIKQKGYQH